MLFIAQTNTANNIMVYMTGTYISFYNLGSFTAKDCKHQGKSTHSLLIKE